MPRVKETHRRFLVVMLRAENAFPFPRSSPISFFYVGTGPKKRRAVPKTHKGRVPFACFPGVSSPPEDG